MRIGTRLARIYASFRALPGWVQVWIALVLAPINLLGFALFDTPLGYWAALVAIAVFALNGVVMFANAGFSNAMALPHLLFWIPLELYALGRLAAGDAQGAEYVFGLALVIVNAISLAFDLNDNRAWLRGDRAIAGYSDAPVVL